MTGNVRAVAIVSFNRQGFARSAAVRQTLPPMIPTNEEPRRRLAAVVFADIAGYTQVASEDEDRALALVGLFQDLARDAVEAGDGRVVKFLGDGALAEFGSAEAAALAALELSRRFADRSREAGTPADLRVAVHLGEVVAAADGDIYGDGVNVASRIHSGAAPGQVLASEDVWRQLRRRPGFRLEDQGQHQLKGIAEPVRVYLVSLPGDGPPAENVIAAGARRPGISGLLARFGGRPALLGAAAAGLVAGAIYLTVRDESDLGPIPAIAESAGPGIAILPFRVNDPELDRWREGMVDLLSTNLDGAGGLRAIDSRTVLARWDGQIRGGGAPDLATALDVARRSGAAFGLLGEAVSTGSDLRLSASVYELAGGRKLGEEQVEGSPDSIFSLVDRLSIDVLDLMLEEEQGGALPDLDLAGLTTSSVAALKSYLEAEAALRRSDFEAAIPAYEEAIEADSTFALAWLHLSDALGWLERAEGERTNEALNMASSQADRLPERERRLLEVSEGYHTGHPDATTLAREMTRKYPDDPQAWYLLGEVLFHLPFQSLASREEKDGAFSRALSLDPSYTPAYIHLLDTAFQYADSSRIAGLLERYEQVASQTGYVAIYRISYELAYGSANARRAAMNGLDRLPLQRLGHIVAHLEHPRYLGVTDRILARFLERPGLPEWGANALLPPMRAAQGRVREAVARLEMDDFDPALRAQQVMELHALGVPLDPELLHRSSAPSPADTTLSPATGERMFLAALLAVEEGRTEDAEALRRRMEALVERSREEGDSLLPLKFEIASQAVDGRAAMMRGDDERALELLEAAFRGGTGMTGPWIMELLTEAGRPEEALRYGEVAGPTPWLGFPMGRLYEQVGDRDRALEAYSWVVLGWENADPELQPRVQQARSAIARLEGLQRG